jgi:hypothetical protein
MTASSFSNYWYHADWDYVKKPPIKCDCIGFNDIPANCGQKYNHKGEATPWCYVSENCPKFYGISRVDPQTTKWDFCPSEKSTSARKYPQIQLYAAEQAELVGKTFKKCRGVYQRSNDRHNGKYIWDRAQTQKEESRSIFWNNSTLKWCVTDKFGRGKLGASGDREGFLCSEKAYIDESWYDSNWGSNVVAHVVGPPETSPQIDPKSCYSAEMCRQVA